MRPNSSLRRRRSRHRWLRNEEEDSTDGDEIDEDSGGFAVRSKFDARRLLLHTGIENALNSSSLIHLGISEEYYSD